MRKLALIAAFLVATPALAEEIGVGTVLGTTMDEVQATLVGMGYEIRKAEMEEGEIEVYFVKDDAMSEVYVSVETGEVTKYETK